MSIDEAIRAARQHQQAGQLAQAEAIFRQVLAQQPNEPDALHGLGLIAHQMGHGNAAVDLIRRAIAVNPVLPRYYCNLGIILNSLGRFDDAIAVLQQLLSIQPETPEAWAELGMAQSCSKRLKEAVTSYGHAIALRPEYPEAMTNLATTLRLLGQSKDALELLKQALALRPDLPDAHNAFGIVLHEMGRLDDAEAAFQNAASLRSGFVEPQINLGNLYKDMGLPQRAIEHYQNAVAARPDDPRAHSNLVYQTYFHPDYSPEMILQEHRQWNDRHGRNVARPAIYPNDRNLDRRLRVAYVSPDLRHHSVGRLILPLLEHHDHEQFEIICYSDVIRPDAMTHRIRAGADQWHETAGLSDQQLIQRISQDQIDLLIDLSLHMSGNRMRVFAAKPAPVQATYLGYAGTSGLETMDYRITDPYLDPQGENDAFYSEKSLRLPESYWCYEAPVVELQVNALPARTTGHVTFGCLNSFSKVSSSTLETWCKLLQATSGSRLLLHALQGSHRQRVYDLFKRNGIEPDRLEFIEFQEFERYFPIYQRIDIGLDPFPYAGGTTTCDSFWMGVPVISLAGKIAVHRAGVTLLAQVGLGELVAQDHDEYVKLACDLANDLPRLEQIRTTLRERMKSSPLMNSSRFASNIEKVYRSIWQRWCGDSG